MKDTRAYPLRTERFFPDRKARTNFEAFDMIMRRRGGKAPREGDEILRVCRTHSQNASANGRR
jgi:hypothetical protein